MTRGWTRPLPWASWLGDALGPLSLSAAVGLAVVNVIVPLAIICLAGRRRLWSMRTMIALPAAVAVPLTMYQAVVPLLSERPDTMISSPRHLFILVTLAGALPVISLALLGWSAIRRHWKNVVILIGLTVLASVAVAVVWLWSDARSMPDIDHYGWSEWYMVIIPGAEAVGVLVIMRCAIKGTLRRNSA